MQVALGEGEEFAEGAGVLDDAEHGAMRAVAAEAAGAPLAGAAGEVDFAHHAAAEQRGVVGFHDFAHELVAGHAGEAVVAALEFEVGVADAGGEEADKRVAGGARRQGHVAHGDEAVIEKDGEHRPTVYPDFPVYGSRRTYSNSNGRPLMPCVGRAIQFEISPTARCGMLRFFT